MDPTSFWNVNLGNLISVFTVLGGGMWFVSTLKGAIDVLNIRVGGLETRTTELTAVLVTLGKYEERFLRLEAAIDDLRPNKG